MQARSREVINGEILCICPFAYFISLPDLLYYKQISNSLLSGGQCNGRPENRKSG